MAFSFCGAYIFLALCNMLAIAPSLSRPTETDDSGHGVMAAGSPLDGDTEEETEISCTTHDTSEMLVSCLAPFEQEWVRYELLDDGAKDWARQKLCGEYYESLQCLHNAFLRCTPAEIHLQMLQERIGDLRDPMETMCSEPFPTTPPTTTTTTTQTTTTTTRPTTKAPSTATIKGAHNYGDVDQRNAESKSSKAHYNQVHELRNDVSQEVMDSSESHRISVIPSSEQDADRSGNPSYSVSGTGNEARALSPPSESDIYPSAGMLCTMQDGRLDVQCMQRLQGIVSGAVSVSTSNTVFGILLTTVFAMLL